MTTDTRPTPNPRERRWVEGEASNTSKGSGYIQPASHPVRIVVDRAVIRDKDTSKSRARRATSTVAATRLGPPPLRVAAARPRPRILGSDRARPSAGIPKSHCSPESGGIEGGLRLRRHLELLHPQLAQLRLSLSGRVSAACPNRAVIVPRRWPECGG